MVLWQPSFAGANAERGFDVAFIGKDRQIRSEALFLLLRQFSKSQVIERCDIGDRGVILRMLQIACKGARVLYFGPSPSRCRSFPPRSYTGSS